MIEAYISGNEDYGKNGDMTLFPETCTVTAELNGAWHMDITHPLDPEGRWEYITEESVVAAPTFMGKKQLFRIDDVEKTDTEVSAKAYPVFFDSADDCFLMDVRPTGKNGQQALDEMTAGSRYSGESDITGGSTAYFVRRNLMDAINGEASPTFLERWGGEILYDNYTVVINGRVGADRGVEIRYGKNMAAVRYRVNMSDVVTRIVPVAYNGYTLSSVGYVDSPNIGKYAKTYVKEIRFEHIRMAEDAEGDAEGQVVCADQGELDAALEAACEELYASGADLPAVTLEIDLVELSNTDEYKDFQALETICLGDTVHCHNSSLDISTDARAIKITWDCIYNEIQSVTLGDYEPDYFRAAASSAAKIERVVSDDGSLMAELVKGILNGAQTQLRLQNTVAKKQEVRAILFEDLDPESELYGALAIGTQGMEISRKRTADGKDWEWTTAATAGGIVADAVITGLLSDKKGVNSWNLDTGELRIVADAFSLSSGQTIDSIAQDEASSAASNALSSANGYTDQKSKDTLNSAKNYANTAASNAVDAQTQEDIFNRLTNNGTAQGIYLDKGQLYVLFTYAKGGMLTLGGINNENGEFSVKDSAGKEIGRWDNRGIMIDGGEIYSKTSGTSVSIYGGRMHLSYKNTDVGYIGTNAFVNNDSARGIVFDLNNTGYYMAWGYAESAGGNYIVKLLYASRTFDEYSADTINFGCNADFHDWAIKNAIINGLSVTGSVYIPNNTKCDIYSDMDFHNWAAKNVSLNNIYAVNGYAPYSGSFQVVTSVNFNDYSYNYRTIKVNDGLITGI